MGKQPYIPLYIGDWEQDTNCLSLEAEGAWLKIVFKCWKNQGVFMASIDSICRLLKVDAQKFANILLELKTNNICDIQEREDGTILFISRRITREVEISRKRADSGSKGGSKKQANSVAKNKQIPEYEYESEVDNESDKERNQSEITNEDIGKQLDVAFDEIIMGSYSCAFPEIDLKQALSDFRLKVRNAEATYRSHGIAGLRNAFHHQLRSMNTRKDDKAEKQSKGSFMDKAKQIQKQQ